MKKQCLWLYRWRLFDALERVRSVAWIAAAVTVSCASSVRPENSRDVVSDSDAVTDTVNVAPSDAVTDTISAAMADDAGGHASAATLPACAPSNVVCTGSHVVFGNGGCFVHGWECSDGTTGLADCDLAQGGCACVPSSGMHCWCNSPANSIATCDSLTYQGAYQGNNCCWTTGQ